MREKIWDALWYWHSEQYRKAWFASFPEALWPAEEVETDDGRTFLKLKDGAMHLAYERSWVRKKTTFADTRHA